MGFRGYLNLFAWVCFIVFGCEFNGGVVWIGGWKVGFIDDVAGYWASVILRVLFR